MYKPELNLLTSFVFYYMITESKPKDLDEQRKLSLVESHNKADIFLGLIEYELNSLLSVHIWFDFERYLLNMIYMFSVLNPFATYKEIKVLVSVLIPLQREVFFTPNPGCYKISVSTRVLNCATDNATHFIFRT